MALQALERLIIANSRASEPAQALAALGTPSTSIAVLENGNITSTCYSTVGDSDQTLFQACSISKPVTALAVMRLIEMGRFSLDSSLSQLLPTDVLGILLDGSPASQKTMIEQITVRQLMSHTSGLSVHGFAGYRSPNKVPFGAAILRGQPPANNLRVRLELLPGLTYSYSGGGFTVLQIILETVTGQPFPQMMQELVLKPLKMDRSFYGPLPENEAAFASAFLTGYERADSAYHFQPEYAAAGLWTTPTDLLKVARAVQQSLTGDGFLKQTTAREMLTKQKDAMGLSWFISLDGTDFFHAGANDPGFQCLLSGFGELEQRAVPGKCGFAIMTNSAEGGQVIGKIAQALSYLEQWPLAAVAGSRIQGTPFWDDEAVAGDTWKGYVGAWEDDKNTCQIGEDAGSPIVHLNGLGPVKLMPAATPGAQTVAGDAVAFVLEGLKLLLKLEDQNGQGSVTLEDGERKSALVFSRMVGSQG